jgi:hypothetical protein
MTSEQQVNEFNYGSRILPIPIADKILDLEC